MLSVILDDTRDPARNLALDEALVRVAAPHRPGPGGRLREPRAPVLRVWQNAPSIVVGRFQDARADVDVAACARDGIAVVRRATGGGAVCFDSGTLAFTLVQLPPAPPVPG
ncbi:lipoate--protein ligase family protein, partial [Actinomadura roseirufa]|uniref:lipoate--protein ligase family protein n=1 Tax=Actinomadura roseirufa TaxID=2094049 RepID=UPI003520A332